MAFGFQAGQLYVPITLDQSKFDTALRGVEAKLKQTEASLKGFADVGKRLESVGKGFSLYVTAPIAALGAVAVKSSIDMEDAFAGVRKTVDATEEQFAELRKGFVAMSKEIPIATTELFAIGEAAGQLGVKREHILDFSEVMAKLGVTTNLSSDQAATALARLANITQMPMENIDRLGATVVALGNSLATTEAEIVTMGLRLAGAGKQVGMTEAQILSFSGALSSVGIEAEAGGSAFSRVMLNINNEVLGAGENLELFAQVAGLSAQEFAEAWKQDAAEALTLFIEGLGQMQAEGVNVVPIMDELGLSELRVRDAILRAAGAGDLFRQSLETGSKAWQENIALNKEAEERFQTTASQLTLLRNNISYAASTFGDILLPVINSAIKDHLIPLLEKIESWDEGTKKKVVTLAGLAATIGPVLVITGKLAQSFVSIKAAGAVLAPIVGTVTTALTGTASAATGASVALGAGGKAMLAAGTAAGVAAGPVLAIAAAIAGVATAGIALHKHMSQDAIPAVQLFGDEVSEATQQAVGGFLDMEEQATLALNQLNWSGQAVTQEMATGITDTFSQMNQQVLQGLDKRHKDSLESIQQFFTNSKGIAQEEQDKILADMQDHHEQQKASFAEKEARIKEIMTAASNEKRALTREEQLEINTIQEEMKETGIRVLSESEVEARVILERMKQQAGEITAQQAAEVVRNSLEQKEKAVAAAEEQYDQTVAAIIRQRDETGVISAEQAQKLIQEATRQRDEAVAKAEDMHQKVVTEAKAQAEEHANLVDWETGEIKTKWQVMQEDIAKKAADIKETVTNAAKEAAKNMADEWEKAKIWTAEKWESIKTAVQTRMDRIKSAIDQGIEKIREWNATTVKEKVFSIVEKIKRVVSKVTVGKNARGTDYWRGGLTWVGEEGPELIELPRGSKVYSSEKSNQIVSEAMQSVLRPAQIPSRSMLVPAPEAVAPMTRGSRGTAAGQAWIDYDRLGRSVAQHMQPYIKPNITQHNKIIAQQPLSPAAVVREENKLLQRLGMAMG